MGKINGCLKCVFVLLNAVFGVRAPVLPLIHSDTVFGFGGFLYLHQFTTKGYTSVTNDTNSVVTLITV